MPLTIVSANLFWVNRQPGPAVTWLAAQDADIVVLQEKSARWNAFLEPLERTYPHTAPGDVAASSDVMVFSRHPVIAVEPLSTGDGFVFGLAVMLDVAGRPITLLAVHTTAPFSRTHAEIRDRQLTLIAEQVADEADHPVIATGDFNLTPYSPAFDILSDAGLSADAGSGTPMATWPVWLPFAGLPIDHVLGSELVAIDRVTRGPDIGSDHYPVVATLRLLDPS